ncbi:MAG TPA: hypothetical protein PJ992_12450 [Arachnia sp.]|nr:hypothetical protein [Arachnia sp.]HMR13461.1 hypothetical protein [Arachnia sp.]
MPGPRVLPEVPAPTPSTRPSQAHGDPDPLPSPPEALEPDQVDPDPGYPTPSVTPSSITVLPPPWLGTATPTPEATPEPSEEATETPG